MPHQINLNNIAIVLNRPRFPENIGAVARSMRNMGIGRLVLVDPENCDLTRILKLATHAASEIVEQMEVFNNLKDALSPYNYVVGTTARLGRQRQVISTPSKIAEQLVPVSLKNRIAILFGPEDKGLSNKEIRYCHLIVNIPTSEFSSLNLAHAVTIMCYEIFVATLESPIDFTPRLACRQELDGMYAQLKDILVRISFIRPENPDYWMNNLRHFFSRMKLRSKEVSIIRGMCRQIDWYGNKCFKDGEKKHNDRRNLAK
jgi:tRNA/rRNA methyltransferase